VPFRSVYLSMFKCCVIVLILFLFVLSIVGRRRLLTIISVSTRPASRARRKAGSTVSGTLCGTHYYSRTGGGTFGRVVLLFGLSPCNSVIIVRPFFVFLPSLFAVTMSGEGCYCRSDICRLMHLSRNTSD